MDKKYTSTKDTSSKTTTGLRLNTVSVTLALVFYLAATLGALIMWDRGISGWYILAYVVILVIIGTFFLQAIIIASQWEKVVVLRFGKFHKLAGPGMFWIVPIVDATANWVDHRVMVTPFSAEKTLTKDTVPVDVDAVLFWLVWDAEKAALEVENYRSSITWGAQPPCAK